MFGWLICWFFYFWVLFLLVDNVHRFLFVSTFYVFIPHFCFVLFDTLWVHVVVMIIVVFPMIICAWFYWVSIQVVVFKGLNFFFSYQVDHITEWWKTIHPQFKFERSTTEKPVALSALRFQSIVILLPNTPLIVVK